MLSLMNFLERMDSLGRARIFIFAFTLTVSLAVFVLTPKAAHSTRNTDYEPQVTNLLERRGFVTAGGAVMDRYPPGYPLLLATGRLVSATTGTPDWMWLLVLSAGSIAVSTLVVYNLSRFLFSGSSALISALLFATNPQILYGALIPLSETPFIAVFLSGVYCFLAGLLRKSRPLGLMMLLTGAIVGLAILIRPAAVFSPFVLVGVVLLLRRLSISRRIRLATMLLVGVVLVLLPWETFIWRKSSQFVLVSTGGVHTMRDGFSFNNKEMRNRIWLPDEVRWLSNEAWTSYSELSSFHSIFDFLKERFEKRPWAVIQTYLFKAARSWYGTDSQNPKLELFNALVALPFSLFALVGVFRYLSGGPRANRASAIVLLALASYFWVITTLFLSICRYMTPAIGLLAPFIPAAFMQNYCYAPEIPEAN